MKTAESPGRDESTKRVYNGVDVIKQHHSAARGERRM